LHGIAESVVLGGYIDYQIVDFRVRNGNAHAVRGNLKDPAVDNDVKGGIRVRTHGVLPFRFGKGVYAFHLAWGIHQHIVPSNDLFPNLRKDAVDYLAVSCRRYKAQKE
jgi:hypothetical protein